MFGEKVIDYVTDVENYMNFEDMCRSDNVGINSDGNIVGFDARASSFAFA